jgi:hypothetical protein
MGNSAIAQSRTKRQYQGSDERYTPPWLLERVTRFLGPGWVDPCPASFGHVPLVNGLAVPWRGRVYCNPPYSRLSPWVTKFLTEPFTEGLLLIPAYTDTKAFQPLYTQPILFLTGRIKFVFPDGRTDIRSPFGSVLVYRGRRVTAFARAFSDLGAVMVPYKIPGKSVTITLIQTS